MNKPRLVLLVTGLVLECSPNHVYGSDDGIYNLQARDISGDREVNFSTFRGKVLLVANLASECGYTDSGYKALQRMQDAFGPTDRFLVLGFPCDQFGGQEPASNHAIAEFATRNYNVDFPMFAKCDVVGVNAHSVWRHLVRVSGTEPKWNFYKYLVDHRGKVVKVFPSNADPEALYHAVEVAVNKAKKELTKKKKNLKKKSKEDL